MAAESFDPAIEENSLEDLKIVYPKSDDQRLRLTNAINEILLFRCLDEVKIKINLYIKLNKLKLFKNIYMF